MKIPSTIPPGALEALKKAIKEYGSELNEKPVTPLTAQRQEPNTQKLDKLKDFLNKVSIAINGGIEFGSPSDGPINVKGTWAQAVSPAPANTEFTITHNLGYIPTGFMVANSDQAAHIYAGGTPWTETQMFLKSDQVGVNFTIFVM